MRYQLLANDPEEYIKLKQHHVWWREYFMQSELDDNPVVKVICTIQEKHRLMRELSFVDGWSVEPGFLLYGVPFEIGRELDIIHGAITDAA